MTTKKICVTVCLLLLMLAATAQKFTISGYITDGKTGERLKQATVLITNKNTGTTSNVFGFFSITLPTDSVSLVISYGGYEVFSKDFYLAANLELNVQLAPQPQQLQGVVVSSTKKAQIQNRTQMSSIDMPIETIKSLPRFLGEADVLKAIQLLPGVQAGGEGQSGLYVRGGGPDQNLIILDGVPVYNVSHLFGFFSVFNADAVKSVELIKGGFPARYGGRLSSVIDIQMKEGNKNGIHGEGGIGIIASRLTLEGPFKKGKESSFMFSARRTYIDVLARPIIKSQADGTTAGYFFYDLNAKVNFKLGAKDHLYISGYMGSDKFYANDEFDGYDYNNNLKWGNITAVVRWNHLFSKKVFGNLTTHYSRYLFDINAREKANNGSDFFSLRYFSGIEDLSARYDLDIIPNPNHYVKAGIGATKHFFKPGAIQQKEGGTGVPPSNIDIRYSFINTMEYDAYVEDDIRITDKFKANLGVHFAAYTTDSNKTFASVQPRIALRYLLNNNLSVKASYTQMNQFIHLLTNSGIGLPTDLWVPVTNRVPPQLAKQAALGVAYTSKKGMELSAEVYYKQMDNIIEFSEGASFLNTNEDWQRKVETGKGNSYGLELFAQQKKGRITGLIGYTLSFSNRQFTELNFGRQFPYKYDRRHDLKAAVIYKVSKRIELSADWVLGTGQAITLPVQKYIDNQGREVTIYTDRNGYRMAPYHRLDISATLSKQKKRHMRSWVFSIYNVYNRQNPFYIYSSSDTGAFGTRVYRQVSLFPILPSISYQFKF